MVQESVEQGGSDDGIPEDFAPFGKATIGSEDHCAALIACVDELEEEISAAGDDGKIADFVDDQQAWSANALLQSVLRAQPARARLSGGQGAEVDALSGLDGFDAEGRGEMLLAGSGRAEEMDGFAPIDEAELGQREDAVAVEGWLKGKVEAGQRLDGCKASHAKSRFDAAVLTQVSSSDRRMSIASRAESSPCSRRRTTWSSASRARGILRPTRS